MTRHPQIPSPTRIMGRAGAAAIAFLAACAPDEPGPIRPTHLDGTYVGTLAPDDVSNCGFGGPVAYVVSGSTIALPSTGGPPSMQGTINAEGRFTMSDAARGEAISGVVTGDRLVATETGPPHHHKRQPAVSAGEGCRSEIDARRAAD